MKKIFKNHRKTPKLLVKVFLKWAKPDSQN